MTEIDHDLTLLGLAERVSQFLGHIEDMSDEERVLVLGLFAGAVSRLQARVRELYAKADDSSYMDALPPLNQVMLALGADEDWAESESEKPPVQSADAPVRPARLSADLTMSDGRLVHVPVVKPAGPASSGRIRVEIPYPDAAMPGLVISAAVTNEELGVIFRSGFPYTHVQGGDTLAVEFGEESLDAEALAKVLREGH
jgi:hypothetical protein